MRRYHIEIAGRPYDVDVEDAGEQRYSVRVGAQAFDVALTGQQELSLARIAPHLAPPGGGAQADAARPTPSPAVSGAPAAEPAASAPPRAPGARPVAGTAADLLGAPMPGVILRLSVAVGAHVRRGQDIAVLEAMKMENVIRAPRDGVIAEVCVAEGQQVGHGEPIVRYAAGAA